MFTSVVVVRSNYFGIDGKELKLKKQNWSTFPSLDAIFQKFQNFNMDSFSRENSFDIVFLVYQQCFCSRIKSQVSFFNQLLPKNWQDYRYTVPLR